MWSNSQFPRRVGGRLLAGLCLALAPGCSSAPSLQLGEVEGAVTSADGKPLQWVRVAFYPDAGAAGPESFAYTDAAGHYRLKTEAGEPGALVGAPRVCLVDKAASGDPTGGRVPREFASVAATPLHGIEVRAGHQTHNFTVPRKSSGAAGPVLPPLPPGVKLPPEVEKKLKEAGVKTPTGKSSR